jgi:hypothetical protein
MVNFKLYATASVAIQRVQPPIPPPRRDRTIDPPARPSRPTLHVHGERGRRGGRGPRGRARRDGCGSDYTYIAVSLDGFIARSDESIDWLDVSDPE